MRIATYITITDREAQLLDKKLELTPFESRTDFLTACTRVFLYGKPEDRRETPKTPDTRMQNWLKDLSTEADLKETIRTTYFQLLRDLALPAIAMRGSKTAYRLLRKDLKRGMLDRCGIIPPAEEMKTLTRIFEEIHLPELIRHRTEALTEQYKEENP